MLHSALRASARLWYSQMLQAAPTTSSPRNSPQVHVGDGPADRVLLFGNGVLHGWGVQLREMAVPGHLAGLLHERTGRATIVDYVGEERMNAASARQWLGDAAGRGHDVAVVAIGLNDALRLTPVQEWRRRMTELVEHLVAVQDPRAAVLLVGLPHVRAFAMADSPMGSLAQRHADLLDVVLQEIAAARPGVGFVAAPEERFEPGRPIGSSGMYRSWAEQLLPDVARRVDAARLVKPPAAEYEAAYAWAGTAAALDADGSAAQQRLDALAQAVRKRYDVASVGVSLLDDGQVHAIAGHPGGPRRMPRSLAYCDRTVARDAPVVVEDRAEDEEFRHNPFLDVVGLPFYAGVPLHASDGRAVATLCLADGEPRDDIDPRDLQQYADDAEAVLRGFEPGVEPGIAPGVEPGDEAPRSIAVTAAPPRAVPQESPEEDPLGRRAAAAALRPLIRVMLRTYLRRQTRPQWDQRAITPGADPLRVLIFGAGIAVGYGSDGGDDPWPAQIGAALGAATGRGVIVETRARPSVPLEQAFALLGRAGTATFDHVVWSPPLEEAARGSSRRWTRQLRRVIAGVRATGGADQHLTLLGLPLAEGDHVLHRISRTLGRDLNDRIAAAARLDGGRTAFLALPRKTIPGYDTPLFDADYRGLVTALLVEHLLDQRRPARDRTEDAPHALV